MISPSVRTVPFFCLILFYGNGLQNDLERLTINRDIMEALSLDWHVFIPILRNDDLDKYCGSIMIKSTLIFS